MSYFTLEALKELLAQAPDNAVGVLIRDETMTLMVEEPDAELGTKA